MSSRFIKLFHEQTSYDFIPPKKRVDEFFQPDEKVEIEYKSYPRMKKVILSSDELSGKNFRDILASNNSIETKFHQGKFLKFEELSTLLHYSCGLKFGSEERFYESQGMSFPLEIYLFVQRVENVPEGVYHYNVLDHSLEALILGKRCANDFGDSVLHVWAGNCAAGIIITGVWDRVLSRYGGMGYRAMLFEAGLVSRNLELVATNLGIDFVNIDKFSNSRIDKLLDIEHAGESSMHLTVFGKQ